MCVDHRETIGKRTREQTTKVVALQSAGVRVYVVAGTDIQKEYAQVNRKVRPGKGILHEKAVLVGPWLIVGSTNWTTSARTNHELSTLLWLDEATREIYHERFNLLMEAGEPLTDEIISLSEERLEKKRQQKLEDQRRAHSSRSSASSSHP